MSAPATTYLDDRHVYVWGDLDSTQIALERFKEERDGTLKAELTVTTDLPNGGHLLGPSRINLLSDRTIKMTANTLTDRNDLADWYVLLTQAASLSVDYWRNGAPLRRLDPSISPERRWLLEPYMEDDGITVLFAKGGSGKGWLALAVALAISTGHPILGYKPKRVGRVAYLDWEASWEETSARIGQLGRPFGIESMGQCDIFYTRESAALESTAHSFARKLAEQDCIAAVVDSKGMAANGAPEAAEPTINLFRAMRRLRVPILVADHVSKAKIKGDDPDMAYGSVYTTNAARIAWSLSSVERPGELTMRLTNTKANNGPKAKPHNVVLTYHGREAHVTTSQASPLPPKGTIIERAVELLQDGDMANDDLATLLDENPESVRRTMNRHKDKVGRVGGLDFWTLKPDAF